MGRDKALALYVKLGDDGFDAHYNNFADKHEVWVSFAAGEDGVPVNELIRLSLLVENMGLYATIRSGLFDSVTVSVKEKPVPKSTPSAGETVKRWFSV